MTRLGEATNCWQPPNSALAMCAAPQLNMAGRPQPWMLFPVFLSCLAPFLAEPLLPSGQPPGQNQSLPPNQTHATVCRLQLQQYQSLMALRQHWGASPHSPLNQSWGTGGPPRIDCPEDAPLPIPDHCSWAGVVCMGAAACINNVDMSPPTFYNLPYYSPCADGTCVPVYLCLPLCLRGICFVCLQCVCICPMPVCLWLSVSVCLQSVCSMLVLEGHEDCDLVVPELVAHPLTGLLHCILLSLI